VNWSWCWSWCWRWDIQVLALDVNTLELALAMALELELELHRTCSLNTWRGTDTGSGEPTAGTYGCWEHRQLLNAGYAVSRCSIAARPARCSCAELTEISRKVPRMRFWMSEDARNHVWFHGVTPTHATRSFEHPHKHTLP